MTGGHAAEERDEPVPHLVEESHEDTVRHFDAAGRAAASPARMPRPPFADGGRPSTGDTTPD